MESDISNIIANLLREAEPDLDSRMKDQAEALKDSRCTDPLIGRWIDTNHVQYLLAAFALNDSDFAENFPKMAHVSEDQRKRIINSFDDHFAHCVHCSLKRGYDLELDSRIERVIGNNRDHLLHQLQPEQPISESDHLELRETVPVD